ncbi:MAG: hydantoinase B/oxoprolinase family protein, partial [Planctomycetales bacterium]|nr:hydantoinase B/oxoprolinase family protein [Planctomycetales bacterium]
ICDFVGGRLVVGPASAGASPGPACYARGGPLTVTDANVLLGRLRVDRFPFPLMPEAARERIDHVLGRMPSPPDRLETLAEGFLDIAVTHMAEAVRAITTARGVDVRDHALIGFGGAAAQHLCRIADALGIRKIIDHPKASVLSAVGMGVAAAGRIETVGIYQPVSQIDADELRQVLLQLIRRTVVLLQPDSLSGITIRLECDCKYAGTDSSIALGVDNDADEILAKLSDRFHVEHQNRFGYRREDRGVELVSIRCEVQSALSKRGDDFLRTSTMPLPAKPTSSRRQHQTTAVFHRGRWCDFTLLDREELVAGDVVPPASLVVSDQSTLIVEPNWQGTVSDDGTITLRHAATTSESLTGQRSVDGDTDEAIQMEIVARRLQSIADAMGEVLRRTAVSVNVKERLDFSCAVFKGDGTLIANAPHVPVHLGAMGHTVRDLIRRFPNLSDGDCLVSNDPYAGGSHLPDVTVVTPVFCQAGADSDSPTFFVASRAHHAEIGGATPGSMPPMATSLAEEGVLIRGFALVRDGV